MAKRTFRPGFEDDADIYADEKQSGTAVPPDRFTYRNRPGQTGLDPMDSYIEGGYAQGLILRDILRGQLRTKNPFFLLLMTVIGGLLFLPMAAVLYGLAMTGDLNPGALCFMPFAAFGAMLLVNVYFSLTERS